MRWDWDPEKNRSNLVKHRISFETAVRAFLDPFALTEYDRHEDGEGRWRTLGAVDGIMVVFIAHTLVGEEGVVEGRIISARLATRRERTWYEQERLRHL